MTLPYTRVRFDPLADEKAIVHAPGVRFTVLTSRLIRMEYSEKEQFEDRPSQVFWYRRQTVPEFQAKVTEKVVEITTEHLQLNYKVSPSGFTPATLTVEVKATGWIWRFGARFWESRNLGGTSRTLDDVSGHIRSEPGLMAYRGGVAVDDSESLVFNSNSWLESRSNPGNQDLYFFGYGHDYSDCLVDYCKVTGEVPLIPRWILGNWWSRYWAYSDQELLALIREFKERQVPLSVCIVDMDWHITKTGNASSGWTGYTWNRELFPDPDGFIAELHALGLKTALNLHPADGIYPHEEQYIQFAEFMGIDPESQQPIPFDCADPKFVEGYFEILHYPQERRGVDFWWIDWQQGTQSETPGLDPLWWLNHLHFYNLGKDPKKRPFVFSRWGGLGNHRYPIGFSGDTVIGWEILEFLPPFTSRAANVEYGWWSHDIGGHMGGIEDDELYIRWIQFGVFSPILRMHCTSNPYHERRPWARGPAAERFASSALRLRHRLIPYIYSMAWRNHTKSMPFITPMYYSHPELVEAYECPQQYWYGSELVAAPFTSPAEDQTRLSRQTIWLPEGDWFDFFSGECLQGGSWRTIYGTLDDIPVFAKAGAIVPMGPEVGWGGIDNPEILYLTVFPGADNRFDLYEDDGQSADYTLGKWAQTTFTQSWKDNEIVLKVLPAQGDLGVIPAEREYRISLKGINHPEIVALLVNGQAVSDQYDYDDKEDTLRCAALRIQPTDELTLTVKGKNLLSQRDRSNQKLKKFLAMFKLNTWLKAEIDQKWPEILAGQVSLRSFAGLKDAQISVLESIFGKCH